MPERENDEGNLLSGLSAWDPLPKPDVFWKRGNGKTVGDDSPEKLWHAVGLALSSYEHLEEELAGLFQFFVESNSNAAVRAYGASNGRHSLLTEASETFFDRRNGFIKDIEDFKAILKHYSCAASFRNEVAHGIVRNFRLHDDDTIGVWFLVAPSYNSRKTKLSASYRYGTYKLGEVASTYKYNAENVESGALKCRALQKRVHYFFMEIAQVYDHDIVTGFEKFPQVFNRPDRKRKKNDDDVSTKPSTTRT